MKPFFNIFKKDISQKDPSNAGRDIGPGMLKNYLNISTSIILALDKEGKITYINKKGAAMLGLPAGRLIGMNWFANFVPKEDAEAVRKGFDRIISGKIRLFEFNENPVTDVRGRKKIIAWHNAVIRGDDGAIEGAVSSGEDITALKESNERLKQSVNKYEVTLETTTSAIASVDSSGKIVEYNRAAAEVFGVNKSEMIGKTIASVMTPASVIKAMEKLIIVRTKGHAYGGEYQIKAKGGGIKDVIISSAAVRDENGKFVKTISVIEDVTERKFMEGVLRDSEEKYRTIFNSVSDAVFVHQLSPGGDKSRFIAVNEIACGRMGYNREEMLKLGLFDITEPEKVPLVKKALRRLIKEGKLTGEAVHVAKDGRKIPVEVNASVFKLDNKLTAIATARDITDRKKNEKMLSEQALFAGLRARLWRLAADKSLSEDGLIRNMLDSIGPALGCVRVIHSVMEGGFLKAVMEWKSGKTVPSALGLKVPDKIIRQLGLETQKVLDVAAITKLIPAALKPLAVPLLKALVKKFGDTPSILTPYYLYGKWAGCINCTAKSLADGGLWSGEKMQLLTEAARIVSAAVEARRTEKIIEKQLAYQELRAGLWRLAADISIPEENLIQLLLDKTGPVVGAERMVFGNPDRDKFRIKLEWKAKNIKRAFIGYSFPLDIYNKFSIPEQKIFDSKSLSDAAPKTIRPALNAVMRVLTKAYGDKPSLITPYLIKGKKEGVIICTPVDGKKIWTIDEKQVIEEAAVIISNVILARRSEANLKQNAGFGAIRAQLWKIAADDTMPEAGIIKGMVEMLGPVLSCSRMVYTAAIKDQMSVLYEWKAPGVMGSVAGMKGDKKFLDIVAMDRQTILTKDTIAGLVPPAVWKVLGPIINMLISRLGNHPALATPCMVDGKKEGVITCTGLDEPVTAWSDEKKNLVLEAAQIITRIIESRRAGRTAKESSMKYKSLFDGISEAVYVSEITGEMNILEANDAACARTGHTKKEIMAMNMARIFEKKAGVFTGAAMADIAGGKKMQFETEQITKTGKLIPVEINGNIIEYDGKKALITIVKDLTGVKKARANEELRNFYSALNTEIWRIAADLSLDENTMINMLLQRVGSDFRVSRSSYSMDVGGRIVGVNQWAASGVRLSISQTIPASLLHAMKKGMVYEIETGSSFDFLPNPTRAMAKKILGEIMSKLGLKAVMAVPVILDSKISGVISFDVETGNALFTGMDENKRKIILDLVNIIAQGIARRRAEKKLERSEKLYREVFNNANDAIVLEEIIVKPGETPVSRIIDFNDMTCSLFEMKREDIKGLRLRDMADGEGVKRAGAASDGGRDEVMAMRTGKGRSITVEIRSKTFEFGDARILLSVVRDVTDREKAESAIKESEEKYRELFNNANDGIFINEMDDAGRVGGFLEVNDMACKITGYSRKDFLNMTPRDIVSPGALKTFPSIGESLARTGRATYEQELRRKDSTAMMVENNTHKFILKGRTIVLTIMRDITDRLKITNALKESEEKYRNVVSRTGQLIYEYNVNNGTISWGGAVEEITGYTEEEYNREVSIDVWTQMIHPDDMGYVTGELEKSQHACGKYHCEYRYRHKNGSYIYIEDEAIFLPDEDGRACRMLGVMKNITQRKEAETAIRESEEKFRTLSEQSMLSIAILQDNVFSYFNDAFSIMNGYSREEITRWTTEDLYRAIHPDDRPMVEQRNIKRQSGEHDLPPNFKLRIYTKDKTLKWLDVYETETVYKGRPAVFITEADITALKETENKLKDSVGELTRSNDELEQFAYVASHDLQEPLRMVSSYVQLLKKRYGGRLGQDADDFIGFAVDGADRMQKLIRDLLVYSRIGSRKKEYEEVDLGKVLDTVLLNLEQIIKETGAKVTRGQLPVVYADEAHMVQLLQNLVSNSLKFITKEKTPEISISAAVKGKECTVAVRDNGIGIEKEYYEKIFVIFQRLHGKTDYPGTGIGLSICRKIVESHGGRIWLESAEGKGTTFYFTVPTMKK